MSTNSLNLCKFSEGFLVISCFATDILHDSKCSEIFCFGVSVFVLYLPSESGQALQQAFLVPALGRSRIHGSSHCSSRQITSGLGNWNPTRGSKWNVVSELQRDVLELRLTPWGLRWEAEIRIIIKRAGGNRNRLYLCEKSDNLYSKPEQYSLLDVVISLLETQLKKKLGQRLMYQRCSARL